MNVIRQAIQQAITFHIFENMKPYLKELRQQT